jgi:hypothetical protein
VETAEELPQVGQRQKGRLGERLQAAALPAALWPEEEQRQGVPLQAEAEEMALPYTQ